MKTKTIAVIVEALGMIKKGAKNMLMKFQVICLFKKLIFEIQIQKTVLNSTAHILREPFNSKQNNYFFNTHYFTPKFSTYNIYTIQIQHNNFYQKYMRRTRTVQYLRSSVMTWCWEVPKQKHMIKWDT